MTNTRHSEASPELDPRVLEALQSFGAHYEVITHAQFYQPIRLLWAVFVKLLFGFIVVEVFICYQAVNP